MTYFLGVDPDLHNSAIAIVDEHGNPVLVRVASTRGATKMYAVTEQISELSNVFPKLADWVLACCTVEGQKIYDRAQGGKADPQDILHLAQVAGAAAMACNALWPSATLLIPQPAEWKKQVPKEIHQGRVLRRLNWPCAQAKGYCYPTKTPATLDGAGGLKQSDWKHAVDAFGLALWARDQSCQR